MEKENRQVNFIRIGASNGDVMQVSKNRLCVVMIMFIIGFAIISVRILEVALSSSKVASKMDANYGYEYKRASILDRNDELLAINLKTASLYANPKIVLDKYRAAEGLVKIFPDLNYERVIDRLSLDRNFVWIKRNLTPKQQHAVNSLGLVGLYFDKEEKRVYPHKNMLSKVVGFVDIDGNGLSGVEKTFDGQLNYKDEYDNKTNDLRLTIDVRAQNITRNILKNYIDKFSAKAGGAVIMDVNNGEIISLVSLPDFDPHHPGRAKQGEKFNMMTLGTYEMGSTFKTFNMAYALESGKVNFNTIYDVAKPIRAANFSIRDYHQKKPIMTFPEVFIYSSNIGSAKIALDVGIENQQFFMSELGLLDSIGLEIPEVSSPFYSGGWGKIKSMTVSYGHGLAVTPLHVVKATAQLVNGGKYVEPTLVLGRKQEEQKIVVSPDTSNKIRKLLRYAVEHGTGYKADARGYLVGGKTGSAEKPSEGKYNKNALISSFIGVFPMNNPKYAVFVMLDEPKGIKSTGYYATGGMVAAPAVKEIIEKSAPILGVSPIDETRYEIRKEFWYDNRESRAKEAFVRDL